MAGRGRTSKRHTEPHISTPGSIGVEGAEGTGGHGRASRSTTPSRRLACSDLAGGRARRCPEHQRSRKQQARSRIPAAPTAWRAARPGRGAGGWWRGLAGLRADAPSEARSADGERAGRRPPAHTAAGPDGAQNTSGATSNNTRRGRRAGGPPPTGTPSSPAHRTERTAPETPAAPQAPPKSQNSS